MPLKTFYHQDLPITYSALSYVQKHLLSVCDASLFLFLWIFKSMFGMDMAGLWQFRQNLKLYCQNDYVLMEKDILEL